MAQICTQIREQPQPEWSCRTRSLIFKVMDLADHFCQPFFEASVDDNIEQSVLDYIHANLYDPIRIEDLCRHFHTNRTTLCRRFKAYCGQSIAQYVQKQRIAQTKYALAFTELSIEDIAIQYGFGDAVYFCKVFKKQVGVSPSVFRKDAKSSRLQVGIAQ